MISDTQLKLRDATASELPKLFPFDSPSEYYLYYYWTLVLYVPLSVSVAVVQLVFVVLNVLAYWIPNSFQA